jgi:hypothetical protein
LEGQGLVERLKMHDFKGRLRAKQARVEGDGVLKSG